MEGNTKFQLEISKNKYVDIFPIRFMEPLILNIDALRVYESHVKNPICDFCILPQRPRKSSSLWYD